MANRVVAAVVFSVLLLNRSTAARAQEPSGRPAAPQATEAAEEAEEHANELAVVVAGTWERSEDETFLTLGVEYGRRLSARVALGGEIESLVNGHRWIVVTPVVFRPAAAWNVFAGPGFERADKENDEEHGEVATMAEAAEPDRETRFLFRVGTGYAVEFAGRYVMTPSLSFDVVREGGGWSQALVFGVSFGVGF
jgi:hypothetical protein